MRASGQRTRTITTRGFTGNRRNLVLTLCAHRTAGTALHTLSLGGRDEETRETLTTLGLSVRKVRPNARGWRAYAYFRTFGDAMDMARRIQEKIDVNLRFVGRLGRYSPGQANSLPFIHASSVRPGMAMFTEDGGYDIVERVERVELDGPVIDLNVEGTHNFVAGGLVTHNSIYALPRRGRQKHPQFSTTTSLTPTSSSSSRTTAPRRPSSPPPTRSSPTTAGG